MKFPTCTIVAAFLLAFAEGAIKAINEKDACVTSHNQKRSLHRDTPLVQWDASLAAQAQQWANELAESGTLIHAQGNFGENLFMAGGGTPATCAQATASWYDEIGLYDWNNPGYTDEVGHFTQVVWKSSKRLGVGIAYNTDTQETYIVARYIPAGNDDSEGVFAANVKPLVG